MELEIQRNLYKKYILKQIHYEEKIKSSEKGLEITSKLFYL